MDRQSTEDFWAVKLICMIDNNDTRHYNLSKPIEWTTRVNPDGPFGLWGTVMYPCSFVSYHNTPLWPGTVIGGDQEFVWSRGV